MSKVEVYLSENQVNNLKSILSQSELGIHVLFENSLIAEAFTIPFSEEEFFDDYKDEKRSGGAGEDTTSIDLDSEDDLGDEE